MNLQTLFENKKNQQSDINEHLETLRDYASQCKHITEMGMREGISTIAFLYAKPETLISYDTSDCSEPFNFLKQFSDATNFIFKREDTTQCNIEETDLLFIDTKHTYDQLSQELFKHATNVKHYIIMHDTITFKNVGEDRTSEGLGRAIDEFLNLNPDWITKEVFEHNNGLTVLSRISK